MTALVQKADKDFENRLQTDPRFLRRTEKARESLRAGRGVALEECETEIDAYPK
jgi:hypothetical protein